MMNYRVCVVQLEKSNICTSTFKKNLLLHLFINMITLLGKVKDIFTLNN